MLKILGCIAAWILKRATHIGATWRFGRHWRLQWSFYYEREGYKDDPRWDPFPPGWEDKPDESDNQRPESGRRKVK